MIFEKIGLFIFRTRKQATILFQLGKSSVDSQLVQILFSAVLIFLSVLLVSIWNASETVYPLLIKIIFTIVYLLCLAVYSTGLYFFLSKKHISNKDGQFTVIRSGKAGGQFPDFNSIRAISLTDEQINSLFLSFSEIRLKGSCSSFKNMIGLKTIDPTERLKWIDPIPRNPKQVNRQTLLEFLSQLFSGFENLENETMIRFVSYYFTIEHPGGTEFFVSTKNISDWRMNKASYLKEISQVFQKHLRG